MTVPAAPLRPSVHPGGPEHAAAAPAAHVCAESVKVRHSRIGVGPNDRLRGRHPCPRPVIAAFQTILRSHSHSAIEALFPERERVARGALG